jgi:hypothetical protein
MWPVHMGAQQMALNARAVDRAPDPFRGEVSVIDQHISEGAIESKSWAMISCRESCWKEHISWLNWIVPAKVGSQVTW